MLRVSSLFLITVLVSQQQNMNEPHVLRKVQQQMLNKNKAFYLKMTAC